ncbi:50S ribosomal protein L6 [Thiohalophilus thiocyanatoxydans]|uniref:Large ribosomal subunit protein uL6 n=1 Tax=Thiohalophilus thiocyanatoxydans TaxID=381308 RepID=A0A4R8IIV0_9GAMM|nr:50S ribosomal protein L6 [Thiohalophilus thiocyanatoxydans]TDX97958.1 LSU ribosomal protein L6P [Thiohalophilus thiocyanatoxydans]
MARITAVSIPTGVEVTINDQHVSVKGSKGTMEHTVHPVVEIVREDDNLTFLPREKGPAAISQSGTARAVINNLITGVSDGFEKKLELVGVGYRAQSQGKVLNLTLGFSHPVNYELPDGVTAETPSQTEVVIRGMDKQQVGQVAAEIRGFRPPEPYKGKGVKYADERIIRKEAKKK